MALVMAYSDARTSLRKKKNEGSRPTTKTVFFETSKGKKGPQAHLAQHDMGETSAAHFHMCDQFQVIIDGKGKLGRHNLAPYNVHFSRAYTPYGPLISDVQEPFTQFGLRPHYDPGAQYLPEALSKLNQIPDREPWQITCPVTFTAASSTDITLEPISGIEDDHGLAAYTLNMKPNAKARAPDPSKGGGQYLVVLKGSLLYDEKEHKAPALAFVYPEEDAFQLHAGAEGLKGLVLNFPRRQA